MSNLINAKRSLDYVGVELSDELVTEQAGYRTTHEIVEGMLRNGERLEAYRLGQLDNYYDDESLDDDQYPESRYDDDPVDIRESVVKRMRFKEDIVDERRRKEAKSVDKETQSPSQEENLSQEVVNEAVEV